MFPISAYSVPGSAGEESALLTLPLLARVLLPGLGIFPASVPSGPPGFTSLASSVLVLWGGSFKEVSVQLMV